VIPRLVAIGVHPHEADFRPASVWLNTAFAISLVWLSVTGVLSWRIGGRNRNSGSAKGATRWTPPLLLASSISSILLPIFGASVTLVAGADQLIRL
jgi:hypothetical protein